MVNLRQVFRTVLSVLGAGGGVFAVLHEFGVKYAEQKGWYDNLPPKVEAATTWLTAIAEPLWFKVSTALVVGIALGMWIDSMLRHQEQAIHQLDRDKIADEAEDVGGKISDLAARSAAKHIVAWQADAMERFEAPPAPPHLRRDRATEVRAWRLEQYGELHFAAAGVIAKAAKIIVLDERDLWEVRHIMQTGENVDKMASYLAKIAVQLRYAQPNQKIITISGAASDYPAIPSTQPTSIHSPPSAER